MHSFSYDFWSTARPSRPRRSGGDFETFTLLFGRQVFFFMNVLMKVLLLLPPLPPTVAATIPTTPIGYRGYCYCLRRRSTPTFVMGRCRLGLESTT